MASAWGKSWGLAFGAAFGLVVAASAPIDVSGGDYYPVIKRKTKKDLHEERVRLGIVQEVIQAKAAQVVAKAASAPATDSFTLTAQHQQDPQYLVSILMAELRATIPSLDYAQSIQLALQAKLRIEQDEDDELILLSCC